MRFHPSPAFYPNDPLLRHAPYTITFPAEGEAVMTSQESTLFRIVYENRLKFEADGLSLENRLGQAERKRLDALASRLNEHSARPVLQSPTGFLQNRRLDVDRLSDRLNAAEKHLLLAKRQEYVRLVSSLEAMSPLRVLARGFSVATDASGAILRDAKAVAPGDSVHIRLEHGALDCRVEHQSEVQ